MLLQLGSDLTWLGYKVLYCPTEFPAQRGFSSQRGPVIRELR